MTIKLIVWLHAFTLLLLCQFSLHLYALSYMVESYWLLLALVLMGSILSIVKNLPTLFIGRIICSFEVGCILQVLLLILEF